MSKPSPRTEESDRLTSWPAVWILAALPLLGWWTYGLFDLDEGFYGAVVAEMNRRGEWITPFYNGHPWFEKPILLYWLAKPCMAAFGLAIGPRLPSVLCTVGTYGVIAWFVRRRLGEVTAKLCVLVLASSLLFVAVGRMMLTDPMLVLCLTAAFCTFWESLMDDPKWRIASAALVGLGILAKGPVAAILFLLLAGWTYAREPELRPKFRGYWFAGVVVLLMVVAAWYVPAYLADGKLFVDKFLIEQNIGRFTGGDAAHTVGIGSLPFYIPIVLVGMAPWSAWLWAAWPRRSQESPNGALNRYLASWAAIVFIFFTISGAKLVHYILPAFPAIAMLVSLYLADRSWPAKVAAGLCGAMCVIANVGFTWWFHASGEAEAQRLVDYVRRQGGDVALYQLGRREKDRGTGGLKLKETDLPSLLMYLNADAIDTGSFDDLLNHHGPLWVFTRTGRIEAQDLGKALKNGRQMDLIRPTVPDDNFHVYLLRSASF